MPLIPGLYDKVVSRLLARQIESLDEALVAELAQLEAADAPAALALYLHHALSDALLQVEGPQSLQQRVAICNSVLQLLQNSVPRAVAATEPDNWRIDESAQRLLGVWPATARPATRPQTSPALSALLTGTRLDVSLLSQLKSEMRSADRIDILCSFIKWSGLRVLEGELRAFAARPGAELRVITTSYMGATDIKAVEFLRALPNTCVKISYDTQRTRLHAKAYLFHRANNFGTAYVGSSNLSHAAITDGLEWNVKVSQYESAHLWTKLCGTFDTYWQDAEFSSYAAADRSRLAAALQSERSGADDLQPGVYFDLTAKPFQQEILDRLQAERNGCSHSRHLVVAATGTGKTMIAAFDYRNWTAKLGRTGERPTLLFVAHREEILKQSLATFRTVLKDQNFGELLGSGRRPGQWQHVFASIQSYNSQSCWQLPPEKFDYVVVDEFHHAAATSYQRLLKHVRPRVLLGLTATPERADGLDVTRYFDGRISAELRLVDAINRKLLSPFQYFGITDSVNLSAVRWQNGRYRADDLNGLFVGDATSARLRADLVLRSARDKLTDIGQARGLAFCVGIEHAHFMSAFFNDNGVACAVLTGGSPRELRDTVQSKLRRREINFIFVVDIYNEGVDIPEVDTVLFLRPTESLTVFLQQLGRGLRLHPEKDTVTVLDFIGEASRQFRYGPRYQALLSDSSLSVVQQIEAGFPHLPAGCSIEFERVAQERVLENIRSSLRGYRSSLARELKDYTQSLGRVPGLAQFVRHFDLHTDDIYRRSLSWSRLCVEAGLAPNFEAPHEEILTKGLRRMQHIDGTRGIADLLRLLTTPHTETQSESELTRRRAAMLFFSLWGRNALPATVAEGVAMLRSNGPLVGEVEQLLRSKQSEAPWLAPVLNLPFMCPLELYSSYTRDELLAGLGYWEMGKPQREVREGVLHIAAIDADVLFVTLNKTESDYSPSTRYNDYAISESLFHWQSQSTTSSDSPTGRRYIGHAKAGHSILLCVREHKNRNGLSCPYSFLGPVDYLEHQDSRPMSITWELRHPMPARLKRQLVRLAID